METFKVEGLRELDEALAQFPKATAKNIIRRTLKNAGAPVLSSMKAGAPVGTGILVSRLGESGSLTANEKKGTGASFLGIGDDGRKVFSKQAARNYVEIHIGAVGIKQNSPIPMWKEFGTFKDMPSPFMRPAWDGNKERALGIIKSELRVQIDKAAKRAARKLGK